MCKLVVSEGNISIENLDKDEVKYLYNMINNTGLLERRIFNELKTKIKKQQNANNSAISTQGSYGDEGQEQVSCAGFLPAASRRLRACVHHDAQEA